MRLIIDLRKAEQLGLFGGQTTVRTHLRRTPGGVTTVTEHTRRVPGYRKWELEHAGSEFEHGALCAPDGRVMRSTGPELTREVGEDPRKRCALPPAWEMLSHAAASRGEPLSFTHNHPSGACFSGMDIVLADRMQWREIRATTPYGGTWVWEQPEKGWMYGARMLDTAARHVHEEASAAMDQVLVDAGVDMAVAHEADADVASLVDKHWRRLMHEAWRREVEHAAEHLGVRWEPHGLGKADHPRRLGDLAGVSRALEKAAEQLGLVEVRQHPRRTRGGVTTVHRHNRHIRRLTEPIRFRRALEDATGFTWEQQHGTSWAGIIPGRGQEGMRATVWVAPNRRYMWWNTDGRNEGPNERHDFTPSELEDVPGAVAAVLRERGVWPPVTVAVLPELPDVRAIDHQAVQSPEPPNGWADHLPRARTDDRLTILNCGLGRDSFTMLSILAEGHALPCDGQSIFAEDLDAVVFADTGAEWDHTYREVERCRALCESMGVRFITIAKPEREAWEADTREKGSREAPAWCAFPEGSTPEYKAGHGVYHRRLPVIDEYRAYGTMAARSNKSCTDNHKVQPMHRLLSDLAVERFGEGNRTWSRHGNPPHRIIIGIAADEAHRAIQGGPKYERAAYPLLELGIGKDHEQPYLEGHGFGHVRKSGCRMCPFQPVAWYWALRETRPDQWAEVLRYEQIAHDRNPNMWVVGDAPLPEVVEAWRARHPDATVQGVLDKQYGRPAPQASSQLGLFKAARDHGHCEVCGRYTEPPMRMILDLEKAEQLDLFGAPTAKVRTHPRKTKGGVTTVTEHQRKRKRRSRWKPPPPTHRFVTDSGTIMEFGFDTDEQAMNYARSISQILPSWNSYRIETLDGRILERNVGRRSGQATVEDPSRGPVHVNDTGHDVEVVRSAQWAPQWAQQNNQPSAGVTARVTELTINGSRVYVRENARPPGGWFNINSGHRMGFKKGTREVPRNWWLLQVATDDPGLDRDALLETVSALDPLGRPAEYNNRFDPETARRLLDLDRG